MWSFHGPSLAHWKLTLVTAQIVFTGSDVSNVSWNADLSHTITASLVTPNGVSVSSAGGGLPVSSSAPEPASIVLTGAGLLPLGRWLRG